jgi:colicin import membrane protein
LSQNELGALNAALIAQLKRCWNPPVGVVDAKDLSVVLQFSLNRDGSVSGQPIVVNPASSPLFQVAVESAKRAVLGCQPFRLPAAMYDGPACRRPPGASSWAAQAQSQTP